MLALESDVKGSRPTDPHDTPEAHLPRLEDGSRSVGSTDHRHGSDCEGVRRISIGPNGKKTLRLTVYRLLDGRDEDVGAQNHEELGATARLAREDLLKDVEQGVTHGSSDEEACRQACTVSDVDSRRLARVVD